MSKKFDDWIRLIDFMGRKSQGVTLKEIMEEFGVAKRTAQRWIQDLCNEYKYIGEETTLGREKRWILTERSLRQRLPIASSDLLVLRQSAHYLQSQNLTEQAAVLSGVEKKLADILSARNRKMIQEELNDQLVMEGFAFRPGPRFSVSKEILDSLKEAISTRKQIKIRYFNKNSQKTSTNILEPYGLLYSERNHYLLARHSDNYYGDEIHHFILHNIQTIEILSQSYELPPDFSLQEYSKDMFGAFKEEPFDVEWRFKKEVANEVKHYLFHPSQTMTENKNGSITVKFRAGGAVEMAWYLYMWGDMVKVVKPKDFWERVG